MAIHLTPAELAKEVGTTRSEVARVLVTTPVPCVNGKIDISLFQAHIAKNDIKLAPSPVPALAPA